MPQKSILVRLDPRDFTRLDKLRLPEYKNRNGAVGTEPWEAFFVRVSKQFQNPPAPDTANPV